MGCCTSLLYGIAADGENTVKSMTVLLSGANVQLAHQDPDEDTQLPSWGGTGPGAPVLACELSSHPPRPDTDGGRLGERSALGLRPMVCNGAQDSLPGVRLSSPSGGCIHARRDAGGHLRGLYGRTNAVNPGVDHVRGAAEDA
jgi:hypothetical protein